MLNDVAISLAWIWTVSEVFVGDAAAPRPAHSMVLVTKMEEQQREADTNKWADTVAGRIGLKLK